MTRKEQMVAHIESLLNEYQRRYGVEETMQLIERGLALIEKRKAGTHADDCLSQYPLPTGMGNWHCDCGAAIDPD